MNPLRAIVAVLAGVMVIGFIDQTLERVLVSALAGSPPADEAAYLAVRNRPLVLGITVLTHALSATLGGYILAKIAAASEVRFAMAAGAIVTIVYGAAFMTTNPMLPPVWVRVAMLIVTAPAMIGGAKIRADARAIQEEAAATRPEERS